MISDDELSIANFAVTPDPEDFNEEANLLDVLIEEKHRFRSSFVCGDATLDLFLDKKNPCQKAIHPALPAVIEQKLAENRKRGELPFSDRTKSVETYWKFSDLSFFQSKREKKEVEL